MNELEEIRECIKSFICEKEQVQKQIVEIEEKRTQLAQQRNEKKRINTLGDNTEIDELGRKISELGNQSQGLQNKLDSRFCEVKTQISSIIDNLVAEGIRKIRKINEQIQELENKIANQKERNAKYQLQRQEFYVRFGRMPELSESAKRESKLQEEATTKSSKEIEKLSVQIKEIQDQIAVLARTKKDARNGNWNIIIETERIIEAEESCLEALDVQEIEPIEDIYVEDFCPIEEIYVEPFELIDEIHIEEIQVQEFEETDGQAEITERIEKAEKAVVDEVEELARLIVEEIAIQQTGTDNISKIEEDVTEDIIAFEETEKKEKVIIPLFGQRETISNIIVKFEDKQLVYKAQISDGEEIKIYPAKIGTENVLLRDKQNREECKEILISYAADKYKAFDVSVINKIDPLICELLIECAEKYNFEARNLIYNYAISFSDDEVIDMGAVPGIIYNLSYIKESELSKKEKAIVKKICKNARDNSLIDIIEPFNGFRKIKYIFKRIFAVNNVKVLPEAKY